MINIKTRVKTIILVILLIACFMLSYFMLFSKNSPIKAIDSLWTEHTSKPLVQSSSNGEVLLITDASQLANISANISSHKTATIKLCNNIDLSPYTWVPIGKDANNAFSGTFDGQNYTILNLKTSGNDQYSGLFGYLSGATIQNVVFKNCNVTSVQYSGIVTGYSNSSTFEKIIVGESESIAKNEKNQTSNIEICAGGISGYDSASNFISCFVNAATINAYNSFKDLEVKVRTMAGGICGAKYGGNGLTLCYFNGKVVKTYDDSFQNFVDESSAGGIVGIGGNYINKCYNSGEVFAKSDNYVYNSIPTSIAGGICGWGNVTIENCFNTGEVKTLAPTWEDECNIDATDVNTNDSNNKYRYADKIQNGSNYDYYIIPVSGTTQSFLTKNRNGDGLYSKRYFGKYVNGKENFNTKKISRSNCFTGGIIGACYGSSSIENSYNIGEVYTEYVPSCNIQIAFRWCGIEVGYRTSNTNLLIEAYISFHVAEYCYLSNLIGGCYNDDGGSCNGCSINGSYYKEQIDFQINPKIEQDLSSGAFPNTTTGCIESWSTLSMYVGNFASDKHSSFNYTNNYSTRFKIDASTPKSIKFKAQYDGGYKKGKNKWISEKRNEITYFQYADNIFPSSADSKKNLDINKGTKYNGNMKTASFAKTLGGAWAQDSSINNGYPYLADFYW